MRYPPRGVRGVAGTTRATRFGALPDYPTRAEEELCLIVQIETAATLPRIEEIAAIDGVDALFIGPSDLAASMGYPGQGSHPEVKAAVFDAVRRIRAAGKPAGVLTLDKVFLRELIDAGTLFTAVGVDASLLATGARALAAEFKAG
jgi:4-hydroxy-2-oxoheptanedioate aldolase